MPLIYQEKPLLSQSHHQVIDKYREWYIIVDYCMSLLLWTLIDCERLVHFLWKTLIFSYRLIVLVSYHKQAATKSDDSFLLAVCYFFINWNNISFFPFEGNFPFSRHDLDISSKGFKIEQIFNMRILIISKPWVLFGLRFLMIFAISSLVNEIVERRLFVLFKEFVGGLLVFSTRVHCLAKKSLKIWAFFLKSII